MPNPTINPAVWASGATFTVTSSTFVAADIRVADIAAAPASVAVTVPAGATVHAVRDPGPWTAAGTQLLAAGAWIAAPVVLGGNWTVTVTAGAAATDPATITVENSDGAATVGRLRLVCRNLAGAATKIEPGGGIVSIDRVLADPSIVNPQVTSSLPVRELDAVTLGASAQATQVSNPMPMSPLPAAPAILSAWAPEPANPVAVTGFTPMGTAASFTAPAVYAAVQLAFRLTVTYDLDASGTVTAGEPGNTHVLQLMVETITHGMVLVIDRSGSMGAGFGTQTRWDAATQAAHAWLDLFRAFRPGPNHKVGIVTFEHDPCNWTPASATDVTLRDPTSGGPKPQMDQLSGFGDIPTLNLGAIDSCTPIGDALVRAFLALGAGMPAGSKASVLLLTDGYENSGRVTIAAQKGPAATTFAAERVTPALSFANDIVGERLFTIAVGASVDEDRLNDLGAGWYQLISEAKQVLPAFAQMLGTVLDAERMSPVIVSNDPDLPPHSLYFPVSSGEQNVAFLVPWPSATRDLRIAWRPQNSTGAFTLVDPAGAGVRYFRRQRHGLMVANIQAVTGSGAATQWRLQHMDGANAQPMTDSDALCMVDLLTKAEVRFDKRQYFMEDPIRLSCQISTGGAAVTGATVWVDVARPGEGLGTFLATHGNRYKDYIGREQPVPGKTSDPQKGKGHMFTTLLELLKLDGLPVVTPPDFELLDDGGHDDGGANDGLYGNRFDDTGKEGTYTFRFRIEGKLPDGSQFSRLFIRSTWIGVRPDPAAFTSSWAPLGQPDDKPRYVLTFTPRAKSGEYLGPFREAAILMTISGGSFDGPLVDNLDGSYSRKVLYARPDMPIVLISVYGESMPPTGPGLGGTGPLLPTTTSCLSLWIAAIRCTFGWLGRLFGARP